MVTLSVVIPYYNGGDYIGALLESVCSIAVSKEIIIVDDGSRQEEKEFCDSLGRRFLEVRVFHKANGGIVSARNAGLRRACGKYVMFADQDDLVNADVIKSAVNRAETAKSDIVFWSTQRYEAKEKVTACDTVYEAAEIGETEKREIIVATLLRRENKWMSRPGHLWQCLFRLDFLRAQDIHFRRFLDIEDDFLFVLDALQAAEKMILMSEPGYYWRKNVRSESYNGNCIPDYAEKFDALTDYLRTVLLQQKVSPKVCVQYAKIQQIEKNLALVINNCQITNVSVKKRVETYQSLKKLNGNDCINTYTPIYYTHGFRGNVWKKIKRKKYIGAMLYSDLHSIGSVMKRIVLRVGVCLKITS
jgi:glycosyltransferase involved in cell wall biosynthesis